MRMGKTCGMLTGLLVAVAGLVVLLNGFGYITSVYFTLKVAGALVFLVGLSLMAHAVKMCSACKECCCCMETPEKEAKHGRKR